MGEMQQCEGYTKRMTDRQDHLDARRWVFKAKSQDAEEEESPHDVAKRVMKSLNEVLKFPKEREGLATFAANLGYEKMRDVYLKGMVKRSPEFVTQVSKEIEIFGFRDWYDELTTKAVRAVEEVSPDVNRSTLPEGSRTAAGVAKGRYVAHELGFGPDNLAKYFLDGMPKPDMEQIRKDFLSAKLFGTESIQQEMQKKYYSPLVCGYSYIQFRTCFFDDILLQWVEDSKTQDSDCNLVLLGAGFDTRFYRLDLPETAHLYEIDASGTQKWKLDAIEKNIDAFDRKRRERIQYVECDFETQSWFDRLLEFGFDPTLPSVFIWEGVIYYLSKDVVISTLKMIVQRFPTTSAAIAFDYFSVKLVDELKEFMKAAREAMQFGIDSDQISELCQSIGLIELDHLSGNDLLVRCMPVDSEGKSISAANDQKALMMVGNQNFAKK